MFNCLLTLLDFSRTFNNNSDHQQLIRQIFNISCNFAANQAFSRKFR